MTELKQKRDELARVAQFLAPKNRDFASSLVEFFDSKKSWSEKQLYWVDTLVSRGQDAEPKDTQQPLELNAPVPQAVQNLIRISELFKSALNLGLKYPKIRLEAEDGQKVVLRYAGPTSHNPGQINITSPEPYGAGRQYFGKILLNGQFVRNSAATPAVLKLINALATDPIGMAKLYGLKTSTCCFCALPLTTSESVTMGYGPICAQRYGLPWGETVETTYTCLTLEKENEPAIQKG